MAQAAFAYDVSFPASRNRAPVPDLPVREAAGLSLSVFADRSHLRSEICEDAEAAGFRIAARGDVAALLGEAALPLGEVALVDCPDAGSEALAALSRLDLRAERSGARLIVTTSADALDDVFACMDRSDPLIMVDPSRADRLVALGEALARGSASRVRELSEEDRLAVLRLTEQVGRIAQRLGGLGGANVSGNVVALDPEARAGGDRQRLAQLAGWAESAARCDGAALPDPRLVRRMIRQRQLRGRYLDAGLFADPAWDMLLDLTAAAVEKVRVSVSSLCIAAAVPPTTALRWIRQMTEAGLLARIEDHEDRRRAFIVLTDKSRTAMAAYFAELGEGMAVAV